MHELSAYASGLGCSLCYGVATILELVAANRQQAISSLHPKHLVGLFNQAHYITGIVLDLIGWLLFLHTAKDLPLFFALSFVAFSLVVSAVIASFKLKVKVTIKDKFAMVLVIVGLVMLGFISETSRQSLVSNGFVLVLKLAPLVLAAPGIMLLRSKNNHYSSFFLAILSGLSFGATGLIARVIHVGDLKDLVQLLTMSLLAYGALGAIYLAAALQRSAVNRINCVLYSTELVVPSILGIIYLGDKAKPGLWPLIVISLSLVIIGTIVTALDTKVSS
jgi:hypothetical protein